MDILKLVDSKDQVKNLVLKGNKNYLLNVNENVDVVEILIAVRNSLEDKLNLSIVNISEDVKEMYIEKTKERNVMKIYRVVTETKIIDYKATEEDYFNSYRGVMTSYYQRGSKSEQMFLSKEVAENIYYQELGKIVVGADEIINITDLAYYVKNVWKNGSDPYKVISCIYIKEIEVQE